MGCGLSFCHYPKAAGMHRETRNKNAPLCGRFDGRARARARQQRWPPPPQRARLCEGKRARLHVVWKGGWGRRQMVAMAPAACTHTQSAFALFLEKGW